MEEIEVFLRLAFMGMALVMAALTLASWYRAREAKLLLAAAGFSVLAVEGVMLVWGIFSEGFETNNTLASIVALNLVALILLYLSVLKR